MDPSKFKRDATFLLYKAELSVLAVYRVPGLDDHGASATLARVPNDVAHVDQDQVQDPNVLWDQANQTGQSSEREREKLRPTIYSQYRFTRLITLKIRRHCI